MGPAGALDMMDFNIGDHNGFSKMALGWVEPYVANTQFQSLVLPALSQSPKILILPKFNLTTMMDEYMLVEFYQPTGLNQKIVKNLTRVAIQECLPNQELRFIILMLASLN